MKISLEQIEAEIKSLGVRSGDTVFLASDLLKVGYFSINREATLKNWVDLLIKVVGDDGTLVVPAYTSSFTIFNRKSNIIFSKQSATTSGSLSQAFQMHPGVVRSTHPTNSCFAIGKYAKFVLDGHDENASSYLPYQKVIQLKGKNLMLGAIEDDKLAPMAMHCAQEALGLTKKHWLAKMLQAYYYDEHGVIRLFTRNDVGGCTSGGHKALGFHVIEKAIKFGKVGRALSALIDCEKSFTIFKRILTESPELLKCDKRKSCASCYGSPIYKHPIFWIRKGFLRTFRTQ
jgi:aminoglycoside 3-N-acetyltransferase